MAQIVLTLSAAHLNRLVDGVCGTYQYQAQIPSGPDGPLVPNPESRVDFARRMIITDTKNMVREWEKRQAHDAAVASINVLPIDIT